MRPACLTNGCDGEGRLVAEEAGGRGRPWLQCTRCDTTWHSRWWEDLLATEIATEGM